VNFNLLIELMNPEVLVPDKDSQQINLFLLQRETLLRETLLLCNIFFEKEYSRLRLLDSEQEKYSIKLNPMQK
jgi:hypothetical protein